MTTMMTAIGFSDNKNWFSTDDGSENGIMNLIDKGYDNIFVGSSKTVYELIRRNENHENQSFKETMNEIRKECAKFERIF